MKILIVDDDKKELEMLQTLFLKWGHESEISTHLEQARRYIKKQYYDLIVLDFFLPDGFGYKIVPAIRDQYPNANIIVMTGNNSPALEAKARQAGGITYYLIKPFEFKALRTLIDHIENHRRFGK